MNNISKKSPFITAYDLLKSAAVILMVIDHLGYYFFPEQEWFRAFGRLCVPIWFFLIGFSNSRNICYKLFLAASIVEIAQIIFIMPEIFNALPLNILFTIMVIRLVIDYFIAKLEKDIGGFLLIIILIAVFNFIIGLIFEYGTLGLILAMFGYIVRHKEKYLTDHKSFVYIYYFITGGVFIFYQQVIFNFTIIPLLFTISGVFLINFFLMHKFQRIYRPNIEKYTGKIFGYCIRFTGRKTLDIYIIHVLVFSLIQKLYF
ncbi:MAG: TraX family protein [Pseudomonadota bacterium]